MGAATNTASNAQPGLISRWLAGVAERAPQAAQRYLPDIVSPRRLKIAGGIALFNNVPEFQKIVKEDGFPSRRFFGEIISTAFETVTGAVGYAVGGAVGFASGAIVGAVGGAIAGFGVGFLGGGSIAEKSGLPELPTRLITGLVGAIGFGVAGFFSGAPAGGVTGALIGGGVLSNFGRHVGNGIAENLLGVRPADDPNSYLGQGGEWVAEKLFGVQPDANAARNALGVEVPPEAIHANGTTDYKLLAERYMKSRVVNKIFDNVTTMALPHNLLNTNSYNAWRNLTDDPGILFQGGAGLKFGKDFDYNKFKQHYETVKDRLDSGDPTKVQAALEYLVKESIRVHGNDPDQEKKFHLTEQPAAKPYVAMSQNQQTPVAPPVSILRIDQSKPQVPTGEVKPLAFKIDAPPSKL